MLNIFLLSATTLFYTQEYFLAGWISELKIRYFKDSETLLLNESTCYLAGKFELPSREFEEHHLPQIEEPVINIPEIEEPVINIPEIEEPETPSLRSSPKDLPLGGCKFIKICKNDQDRSLGNCEFTVQCSE